MRGLAEGDFGNGHGGLVHLFDAGTDLDLSAAAAVVVLRAVRESAGREVRIEFVFLSFQYSYRRIYQLIEIVRKDFRGHTDSDAVSSLGEQQRKADRQFGRFLVATVVGCHPAGEFRFENDFFREFGQTCLNVTGGGIRVAGKDVSPVTLALHGKTLLAYLDQGSEYGGVSVRMILHSLSYDVRDLGETAVVNLEHSVQDPPLDRFESIHDVGYGPLENDIGGIVQEPLPEHSGEFEFLAVFSQQTGEPSAFDGVRV